MDVLRMCFAGIGVVSLLVVVDVGLVGELLVDAATNALYSPSPRGPETVRFIATSDDAKWDDPLAWDVGRPPCDDNNVVIGGQVTLQGRATLLSIEPLPDTEMHIYFEPNAEIEIVSEDDEIVKRPTSICPSLRQTSSQIVTPSLVGVFWQTPSNNQSFTLHVNDEAYDQGYFNQAVHHISRLYHYSWFVEITGQQLKTVQLLSTKPDAPQKAIYFAVHNESVPQVINHFGPSSLWEVSNFWKPGFPCNGDHVILHPSSLGVPKTVGVFDGTSIVLGSIHLYPETQLSLGHNVTIRLDVGNNSCQLATITVTTSSTSTSLVDDKDDAKTSDSSSTNGNIGLISGTVGGILGVVVIVLLAIFLKRRKIQTKLPQSQNGEAVGIEYYNKQLFMINNELYSGPKEDKMESNVLYESASTDFQPSPANFQREANTLYESGTANNNKNTKAHANETTSNLPKSALFLDCSISDYEDPSIEHDSTYDSTVEIDLMTTSTITPPALPPKAPRLAANPFSNNSYFAQNQDTHA
eukprot:gene9915-2098_t